MVSLTGLSASKRSRKKRSRRHAILCLILTLIAVAIYFSLKGNSTIDPILPNEFEEFPEIGYVHYRTYQSGPAQFKSTGLMKRDFRKQGFSVSKCQWSAPGLKVAHGVVVISVPGVYDSVDYDVVVLTCNLIRAPDFNKGGVLTYVMSQISWTAVTYPPHFPNWAQRPPISSNLSICSYSPVHIYSAKQTLQWVYYHRIIHGVNKFHLYDIGTMDPSVLDALRGLLSEGIVEISNVKNLTKYKSWETGTLLPINDCLFRAYKKSRWIVYVDPLSFLHVQKGPSSMSEFMLQKFEQSVYTLGNHEFASWICEKTVEKGNDWYLQKMVFRKFSPICMEPLENEYPPVCQSWRGNRRLVVDPSRTSLLQKFDPVEPKSAWNLATHQVVLFSFYGADKNSSSCTQLVDSMGEEVKDLVRDYLLAELALEVRIKAKVLYNVDV